MRTRYYSNEYRNTNKVSGSASRTKALHTDEHNDCLDSKGGLPISVGYLVGILTVEWAICRRIVHDVIDDFFSVHTLDLGDLGSFTIIVVMYIIRAVQQITSVFSTG